jgi:hypothetical protein
MLVCSQMYLHYEALFVTLVYLRDLVTIRYSLRLCGVFLFKVYLWFSVCFWQLTFSWRSWLFEIACVGTHVDQIYSFWLALTSVKWTLFVLW